MKKDIIVQKEKVLVNGIYKLTLDEQRLFHYAIAKVNPFKDRYGFIYTLQTKELIDFYEINSGDAYTHFSMALEKLFNRQVTYWDEKQNAWNTCRFIVNKYSNDAGLLGLRFSHEIQEMITVDKDFLSYKLYQTVGITSPNANRIYEILLYKLQRSPINKLTKNIPILELKQLMGLDDKYSRFVDFKKYVIDVAKTQINKHTDIKITYEVIKTGRTPTHIKFTAQFKKGRERETVEQQSELPNIGQSNSENTNKITDEQRQKGKSSLAKIKEGLKTHI